jgi:hypothetical protein
MLLHFFLMGARSDVQAALAQLDAEIAEAEQTLEDLRLQRRGAEALLSRLPVANSVPRIRSTSGHQRSGGNADVVAGILANAPDGLDLRAIEKAAAETGHVLDNEQIRSAVTYLRRRGDAERVGRGVWRLLPTNAEGPGASGPSVAPPSDEGVPLNG